MSDNTCAQCNGYGWDEAYEDRHPCYHCRTTGKCDCDECTGQPPDCEESHPTAATDTLRTGWAVYITLPIYNNMDGIVGSTTKLQAIFDSEASAEDWCRGIDGDHEARAEVKPCKFEVQPDVPHTARRSDGRTV